MKNRNKTVLVLGATGLVGGILLDMLLKDERYDKVVVFSRRPLNTSNTKLKVHIGDLLKLESFTEQFKGDEVFCCVGSTQTKTPDLKVYRKVDYGIPVAAAKLCKQNDIGILVIISALGADAKSSLFYNKMKGEMEETVLAQKLKKTHFVQPALIGGKRTEKRPWESFFKFLLDTLDGIMIGPLKKYKIIMPETIAAAMLWLANNPYESKRIPSETLKELAKHGTS